MRRLPAPHHDERHWLIICAMISSSPQPAVWALLVTCGVGLSLWIAH
ncbi:hypothetical protein ABZS72_19970 [Streptomyces albidoflavus]